MYYGKNLVGKQCICCENFIPISGTDDYGHQIEFNTNPIGLCDECFNTLKSMISKNREDNKKNKSF